MTSIVVWPNYEVPGAPAIWVAGDSLVSNPDGSTLIEDAAKLLGLPVVCRGMGPDKFFSEIYFAHSFGYCFAGSTLMGQNAYLALAPLLTSLISPQRYIPSMEDIATFVLRFLRRTFNAYKIRVAAQARFEAALFGWCHARSNLEIWHFRPEFTNGVYEMGACRHHATMGTFLYLGSGKESVQKLLQEAITTDNSSQRVPRRIVQALINDPCYPQIGGNEQLAIANQYGFQIFPLLKPREMGKPMGYMTYLGMELSDENAIVGEAWVGGPGMA